MKSLHQVGQSFCWKTFQQLSLVLGNSSSIHSSVPIPTSDELAKLSMRFQTIGLHDQLWSSSAHRLPLPCSIIPESKWFTMVITWKKWIINPWDQWQSLWGRYKSSGRRRDKKARISMKCTSERGGNGNFKQPFCQIVPCELSGHTGLVL